MVRKCSRGDWSGEEIERVCNWRWRTRDLIGKVAGLRGGDVKFALEKAAM